ncbi:hypothetical protein [Pseudomonas sp. zfem002]|uniref:hypothetical protein n=1 Tax=Pseudomonas sp. zfem002 TaxID=3078197 RepID=UPI002927E251|nr:hypothetical protein [Pseudomonas sp. zfem002]MDU9392166.1 hypothetical protein [Pseudomonas sp. zfem002]
MNITDMSTWPHEAALLFVGSGFLFLFINIGMQMYISKKYLPTLMTALSNSPYALSLSKHSKPYRSKSLTFGLLAGLVLFKNASVRAGDLCAKDVKNFPRKLERIIKLEFSLSLIAITGMVVIGILSKIKSENSF